MIDEKIKNRLTTANPFWKGKYAINYKERNIYPRIKRLLPEKQIISLCGLRRTGKTTLLKKIITDLLEENPPDSILYFSFDDYDATEAYPVLDAFENIHGKQPKFIVFDEVQKLPNWAEKIKVLYDTGQYKIFVSGSESLFLRKGTRESLAGRIYEFEIKPLTFSEYLRFAGKTGLADKPQLYEKELAFELEKYLLTAGFPETIGKDAEIVRDYLRTALIEKIVFGDMARAYAIENPAKLIAILDIIIDNPGMLLELSSLSQELGITRQTLANYFEYLESAHLVFKLYNYSANRSTSEKRLKKVYPSFLSPAFSPHEGDAYAGKILEAACARNTSAEYFFRDKYHDEVDLVLRTKNGLLPVEIKRRNDPKHGKGLEKFCKKYACKRAVIVTKGVRKREKTAFAEISYLPAWEFLLDDFDKAKPA